MFSLKIRGVVNSEVVFMLITCLVKWKLRQLMADRQISNKVLAEMVEVHPNTVSRWRSSNEMPKVDGSELNRICSALNCELWELIEWSPTSKKVAS